MRLTPDGSEEAESKDDRILLAVYLTDWLSLRLGRLFGLLLEAESSGTNPRLARHEQTMNRQLSCPGRELLSFFNSQMRNARQVVAASSRGFVIESWKGCREAQSSGRVGAQGNRRIGYRLEETHVKVRKALCAAASASSMALLGQTAPCLVLAVRSAERIKSSSSGNWASHPCPALYCERTVEGCGKCRGRRPGGMRETTIPLEDRLAQTGHRAQHAWHQIMAQKVVRWLGAPSAARPCPTLRPPPNHIVPSPPLSGTGCALAPMAAGAVSGRWATAQTCSNSHRRPTVPDQFSRRLLRRQSAWCLRRPPWWKVGDGGTDPNCAGHWTAVALIFGRFLIWLMIACARSSSPNPFPVSPPSGRQAGHEAATACATSPAEHACARLPFPAFPGSAG